jgi:glutamine---fructose-6-phosphate transaminase (isomerizing)
MTETSDTKSPPFVSTKSAEATLMFAEAAEAASVVERQLLANAKTLSTLAARLRDINPTIIFTCARGSSDHAATFAKYLFETQLGIPTLSQAPSISSIYGGALLHMTGQPFILVSQSGRSPDLLASARAAKQAGAVVIAFVNDTESPLAGMAEVVVPLHAGRESSVAATKSYIATLSAFVQLVRYWRDDAALGLAIDQLSEALRHAWSADWTAGVDLLANAQNLFVLGRGLTLGIAQEAALKFKETCGIHGEAFSIAEVAHGPMALVGPDFPILVFPPLDKAAAGLDTMLSTFAARGAPIVVAEKAQTGTVGLPVAQGLHSVAGPIVMAQSFYRLVNSLAVRRGFDPDSPPMLRKVTETR